LASNISTPTRRASTGPSPQPRDGNREATVIVVKAVPRPSKKHRETVCCAGITAAGGWRRLYPVRFRQLVAEQQFVRWQWVDYAWRRPSDDNRGESRRIEENTLQTGDTVPARERLRMLLPLLRGSTREAAERGESLALIEPRSLSLKAKPKTAARIDAERAAFESTARQQSLLDADIRPFDPCPYAVGIAVTDQDGEGHMHDCGDWETTGTFHTLRKRGESDTAIIAHLRKEFTETRSGRRIFLAMGTVKARPRQWLLLGVLRVQDAAPGQLPLGI